MSWIKLITLGFLLHVKLVHHIVSSWNTAWLTK